ncbi:MAG: hypothetical protein RI907_3396 [Pseudomonadota bacterium]
MDRALGEVLAHGHLGLRFPPALESAFQAHAFAPRRLMQTCMALLGLLSFLFISRQDEALMPDLSAWLPTLHGWSIYGGLASLVLAWAVSWRWPRTWIMELATVVNTVGLNLVLMGQTVASLADTALTHSNTIAGVILYVCIASRLRFRWALGSTLFTVVAYGAVVHGHTPWQAQVAGANLALLCLVGVFTLLLNYAFEHADRRHWLLQLQDQRQRARMLADTQRLQRLSTEDPLTGLPNRRQFDADLLRAWSRAASLRQPLSLVMLDVDHFKAYNDTHGHPTGDTCLRQIADVLATWARQHHGQAVRLGGEEFACLLPDQGGTAAATMAQGLCEAVAALQRPHRASPAAGHVTVSVGVAEARPGRGVSPEGLLKAADTALYTAKDSGRNRVCLHPNVVKYKRPPGHAQAEPLAVPSASPLPPPAHTTEVAQPPQVRQLQSLLTKGLWRLRFPRDLEQAYLNAHADERRVHIRRSALLALVLFNAYLFGGVSHFPDVPVHLLWALAGLSGVMVGAVWLVAQLTFTAWQRELAYSLGITVVALASAWVLSHSQASTVWSFLNCFMLIPLFAGAAARLPFRFALAPTLLMLVSLAWWFEPATARTQLIFHDTLANVANAALYPMLAAYALDHAARRHWLMGRIAALQQDALRELGEQLQRLSMTDPLTGLPNRRQFEEGFARLHAQALVDGARLATLVIDVDHFKRYNDGLGHPAGDACLREIAQALSRLAEASQGVVARLGGEEFGLLALADPARAQRLAELACAVVRERRIPHAHAGPASPDHVTVSVGVCSLLPAEGDTLASHLAHADAALYQAKSSGRNRAQCAQCAQCAVSPAAPTPVTSLPTPMARLPSIA